MEYFILYLCIVNALGFALMLADKKKAIKKQWRIPEKTLLGVALIGGSVGSLLGMYTFRHKTKHITFTLGVPVILVLQLAALTFFLQK